MTNINSVVAAFDALPRSDKIQLLIALEELNAIMERADELRAEIAQHCPAVELVPTNIQVRKDV
jgi:hypothetical protein